MQQKDGKRASAAKSAARKSAVKSSAKSGAKSSMKPGAASASAPRPRASKNLLTAGIQALTNAHEQAVARQGRVFESLLGIRAGKDAELAPQPNADATPDPLTAALDPFGFRKFEDVFDQRVARSMEHLGVPSADAFAELRRELDALRARLAALESPGRKR